MGFSDKFGLKLTSTAPTVTFETGCFHPNVDQSGYICLDILKENWSAVYNVQVLDVYRHVFLKIDHSSINSNLVG